MDIAPFLDAKIPLTDFAETPWDLYISALNESDRVKEVYKTVSANRKFWWAIPEYKYTKDDLKNVNNCALLSPGREADVVKSGLREAGFVPGMRVCIDITGLMRPQILFLMHYLKDQGVPEFHFLYTEPKHYSRRAETRFAIGEDVKVQSVFGYIGAHNNDTSGDVLLIGIGYDHHLISQVLQAKENARIIQIHSFPSLSADMYHESILRLDRVRPEGQRIGDEIYYSSANDPYIVASTLDYALKSAGSHRKITNIYLSPLATKPQAVGFGLFFLRKCLNIPASILYPNCDAYDRETGSGVGRSWVYPIVL